MLFNSLEFLVFLPIIFSLYWLVNKKELRIQNALLLIASYYFYSCWDWRFLFLLMFSTLLDYFTGIKMCQNKDNRQRKRFWFWLSVIVNLGFLGIFKYYNFFVDSFVELLSLFGVAAHPSSLQIILPVGISFYTFHGLSYVIDIYKDRIKAERNFVDYALFVSFFPLLVAGPIERATHLLPQLKKKREFQYGMAVDGLRQILWGIFKKVVIADNCAICVNYIFSNYTDLPGSTLVFGAIFFSIQIYGDFSGYTDIAIGVAKLFGIQLLKNFSYPYFSRDIAEFWRRWHISLTTWFRDYLYIPLGGSRCGTYKKIRNTFIIFLVSGFWHGANWTFIVWGLINAFYFLPLLLSDNNRKNLDTVAAGQFLPTMRESFAMLSTFGLTMLAWIFFRSNTLTDAVLYISGIFSKTLFSFPIGFVPCGTHILWLIPLCFLVEWLGRTNEHALQKLGLTWKKPVRYAMYYGIIILLISYLTGKEQQFIYFQF